METKRNTVIVNGKLIDIEKAPIEELKRLKREREEREQMIKKRINYQLANED